jgi:uncharacterized HAD superfamily protein
MIIGVDIDGTLTLEEEGHDYNNRTPDTKVINKINKKYEEGHTIILFSSRWESDREVTKRWMKRYGVKYHALILGKPKFDLYVDRRTAKPEEV